MPKIIGTHISIELDPKDEDVSSKINLQVNDDMIRVFLHDCHESICWRFKAGPKGIQKLERVKVMIDLIEKELLKYEETQNKHNESDPD